MSCSYLHFPRLLLPLSFALLLLACNSNSTPPATDGSAGTSTLGTGGGGGGGSAGSSTPGAGGGGGSGRATDAAAATDSSSPSDGQDFGQIILYAPALSQTFGGYLSASFSKHMQPAASSCTTTAHGACAVTVCPPIGDAGAGAGTPPSTEPHPHAGAITVESSAVSYSETLQPDADGLYPTVSLLQPVFRGGESVAIRAAGGDVPAFEETVTYPLLLLMTAPAVPQTSTFASAPRTQDLTLAWTRGAADLWVQVQGASRDPATGSTTSLYCSIPSESGSATIPSAALSSLATGTSVSFLTVKVAGLTAGSYAVNIVIGAEVLTPDKTKAVQIKLE
jgi:hypothetical protein